MSHTNLAKLFSYYNSLDYSIHSSDIHAWLYMHTYIKEQIYLQIRKEFKI